MATIFMRDSSDKYYARFSHGGKRYCFCTDTADERKARRVLRQRMAEIRQGISLADLMDLVIGRIDALEDQSSQDRMRHELARRLMQGASTKLALSDAWQAWLENPNKGDPGPATLKQYLGQWHRFTKWIAKSYSSLEYLHEITPLMAEKYVSNLWASEVTPRTYNAHTAFLKSFFRVLKTQGGLNSNAWDEVPCMRSKRESKRNLNLEELQTVCSKATGNLRYWFAIGLYTGLRLGDVVTMRWNEVKLEEGFIDRIPMKTRRTNKVVRFPIHPVLYAILLELRAASDPKAEYLFPADCAAYQADGAIVSKRIQKFLRDCGIETHEESTDKHRSKVIVRVGFHSLRHSFVSLCAANRVPQVAIMELVGHGSPAMTALYSHAGDEQKAKAIAALPMVTFDSKGIPAVLKK
ncbi:MAG: tyrosine-type recombinase/integrase [bacterium]